jgi:hypothetical protein
MNGESPKALASAATDGIIIATSTASGDPPQGSHPLAPSFRAVKPYLGHVSKAFSRIGRSRTRLPVA